MARKPKKGPFKYNLATVLKVREIKEKLEKEKFSKAQKEYLAELEKEEQIKNFQNQKIDQQRQALTGKISNFGLILQGYFHLGKVKVDVKKQEEKRLEAEQRKEEQRERLIRSMLDRKIMDKDKEKKKIAWRKLMDKEETKFLDDLSTGRYSRSKKMKEKGEL